MKEVFSIMEKFCIKKDRKKKTYHRGHREKSEGKKVALTNAKEDVSKDFAPINSKIVLTKEYQRKKELWEKKKGRVMKKFFQWKG